jgi:phosphate/phosphite/phosphonate ABC transporter binding protein
MQSSSSSTIRRLSFGLVVPPLSRDTGKHFEELASWVRTNAELDLVRRPAATYKELVASVREGTSDIAWLPPVAYAWLAEAVTPIGSIVREGRTTYSAALVVRHDSPLRTFADLSGVRAGWVDPWSAAGYVVPRLELARAGIDPQAAFRDETFFGSHRDALLALARDECDVVGTYARPPLTAAGDSTTTTSAGAWSELGELRVHVLATFWSIPPDVIAVRRNLAPDDHEHTVRAFRDACSDVAARPLVRAVFGGDELHEGLEPGHDSLRRAYEIGIANGLFD